MTVEYIWIFLGAMVLVGAIGWAALHNRQTRREYEETERATRALYQDPLDHETTRESR